MTTLMDRASSLNLMMLSQLMEDVKLGIGPTQNVCNAHETGYLIPMVFVSLFLMIVELLIQPDFALDAIKDMKLIMEHVSFRGLIILLYQMQDAKFGIGKRMLVMYVLISGIFQMEFVQ